MASEERSVVQGTLDMLILKTLALEPMHGYGIGTRITQTSRGVFNVNAGSLFPAFRRLERDGLVKGEWRATENNRRAKYYALTPQGRATLKRQTQEWESQATAISLILKATRRHVGASIQRDWSTSLGTIQTTLDADTAQERTLLLRAISQELGADREAVVEAAVRRLELSHKSAHQAYVLAEQYESNPRSVWGYV